MHTPSKSPAVFNRVTGLHVIGLRVASIATTAMTLSMLAMPAQALDIKQEQINACAREVVAFQVADAPTANQLCTCTVNVRSNMTIGQMWEIESYAQSGKDPATLPYAAKLQSDMQRCAQGLTLNPPRQPNAPTTP